MMLTIGQVASRAGLRASAIRYYEAQRLLPTAYRKNGRRLYHESILERLAVIALAKMAGFDLEEIRVVLSRVGKGPPAPIWRAAAQAKQVEIDGQMRRLSRTKDVLASLAGCTCETLEECGRAFNAARSKQPPNPSEATARRRWSAKARTQTFAVPGRRGS